MAIAGKKIFQSGVHVNSITNAQLTAVGQTTAVNVEGFLYHTYQVKGVENTSTDVRYQFEASLDGTTFFIVFPINPAVTGYTSSGGLHTVTADGTYQFEFIGKYLEMRFNWVTETGNTDAVIDVLEMHGT